MMSATESAAPIESEAVKPRARRRPRKSKQSWWDTINLKTVLAVVIAAAVALLAYGYIHTRNELKQLSSKSAQQDEAKKLTDKLGNYIVLPSETPTLATVKDVSKLRSQAFFKNAQNGDKVLIFNQANRALLYRPSTSKIIEYAIVDLNNHPG